MPVLSFIVGLVIMHAGATKTVPMPDMVTCAGVVNYTASVQMGKDDDTMYSCVAIPIQPQKPKERKE